MEKDPPAVWFLFYTFLEQQTLRKLPPLGLTHHAQEYQLALLKAADHPGSWQATPEWKSPKNLACEFLLVSSRTGSTPPSELHVAWCLQYCAGMVKCHSLSVMMVPKHINFGIALTAGVGVLVEEKISAMLVWICYKLFVKFLLTNVSFPSCLYNSVFEAYRELKDIYLRDATLSSQNSL